MIACVRIVEGSGDAIAATDALAATLTSFSDRVEPIVETGFLGGYVDLGPLSGVDAARELGITVGRTVREQCRVTPALGLAQGKYPARVAARIASPHHLILVERGQEANFLAPRAIEHLSFDGETLRRLHRLGIHTLGQFAALPAAAVLQQFGRHGQRLHRLARGDDDRTVVPYRAPERIHDAYHFDDPVATSGVLEAMLCRLAEPLAAELTTRHVSARHLCLVLHLEDGTRHAEQRSFSAGITGTDRLYRSFCHLLSRIGSVLGVAGIEVCLSGLDPVQGHQLDLFGQQMADTSWLKDALPALAARYGAGSFYAVAIEPDAARVPERRYQFRIRVHER